MVIWGKYCDTGIGPSECLTEAIIVAHLALTHNHLGKIFVLLIYNENLHDRARDKELSRQMVGS